MNKTIAACVILVLFIGLDLGYMIHDLTNPPVPPQTITLTRTIVQTSTETAYEIMSPFLHVQGTQIVDANGTAVHLHGTNFMGYEFGAVNSHTFHDYQNIASLGFNVVRLPIAWAYVEPEPGHYDTEYLARVDRDVAWAKALNLYIIIDMHQYFWSSNFLTNDGSHGGGMPLWTVNGYSENRSGLYAAVTHFWQNTTLRDSFQRMWQQVASRYKNDFTVIGYDLLNEPLAGNIPVIEFTNITLPQFYKETMAAIRQVDPNHMFFYEAPLDALYLQVKVNAPNVVFSPHFYYFAFSNAYDRQMMLSKMEWTFKHQTENMTVPIWVGEFGIETKTPNYQAWIQDTLQIFSEYRVGWAWWTYWKDDDPSMSLATSNGTLKPELASLLKQGA